MASLRIQLRNISKVSVWPSMGYSSCKSWGTAGAGGVKAEGWTLLPPCLVENWGLGDGRLSPPSLQQHMRSLHLALSRPAVPDRKSLWAAVHSAGCRLRVSGREEAAGGLWAPTFSLCRLLMPPPGPVGVSGELLRGGTSPCGLWHMPFPGPGPLPPIFHDRLPLLSGSQLQRPSLLGPCRAPLHAAALLCQFGIIHSFALCISTSLCTQ